MLEQFKDHIATNLPFLRESKLLIAISGGIDSVVLLQLCHQSNLDIALAHCNFKLRHDESDADEAFVLELAERLNSEVFIQSFETELYADNEKLSTQMAARQLRYQWFSELATQLQFDYVLTAHHADDNLETFLINLSRGAGLKGLTGIPEINEISVRPLLPFSRDQIEAYAKENKLEWREDSSNASNKYLRNALRHDVIPKLKEINPQFLANFNKTITHLKDSTSLVDDAVDNISDVLLNVNDSAIYFDIAKLKALTNTQAYLYEVLSDFGFTQWDDIYHLLNAQSGKYVVSKSHRLLKDRTTLILSEINLDENDTFHISEHLDKVETPLGQLKFISEDHVDNPSKNKIFIDKDKLKFPLVLRKWRTGDQFQPSGMQGSKKLSKYFKDEKLALIEKEKVWLLCSEDVIVWILGMRANQQFVATEETSNILKIELH